MLGVFRQIFQFEMDCRPRDTGYIRSTPVYRWYEGRHLDSCYEF